MVSAVLRHHGRRVRSAADGVETMAHAERFRPDAVVMDLLLPDSDGLEVASRIRAPLPGCACCS
ncbi:response regulator [Streptomyces sp. S.PB5]|uniref:response regulator n=1 Tax=Streptomyces sp. S.PB5 TaxID=3020844 RepID=UPI0025B1C55E|nr:response regulator [Streptomyces sp. S.PB5]MDN3029251.1 response regulator [Streptomyces sp. S.PB5]